MAEEKKTTKTVAKTSATKTASKATKPATKTTKAVEKTPVEKTVTPVEKTSVKKESAPAKTAKAKKQIKVTLVKSTIGYNCKQAKVVRALGLKKLNSSHVLPDNECVRGMVNTVSHLVKVEELN